MARTPQVSEEKLRRLQYRFDEEVVFFGRAIARANPKGGVQVAFKGHHKMTPAEQQDFESAVEKIMREEGFRFQP